MSVPDITLVGRFACCDGFEGKLVAILNLLYQHWQSELDNDLARGSRLPV